jgi:predicted Rossmann-fold nucleotide-binding protein
MVGVSDQRLRIAEKSNEPDTAINAANNALYADIKTFAALWTKQYGNLFPILSGAGPGIMEAAHPYTDSPVRRQRRKSAD